MRIFEDHSCKDITSNGSFEGLSSEVCQQMLVVSAFNRKVESNFNEPHHTIDTTTIKNDLVYAIISELAPKPMI